MTFYFLTKCQREETDQLRSANNRLMMDLEHFAGVELRLEEARQRLEETTEVVHRKNDELRLGVCVILNNLILLT